MSLIPFRGKQSRPIAEPSSLAALRSEIDRLFDSFVRGPLGSVEWPFGGEGKWAPAVDVAEDEDALTIRAEVPGVEPDDLSVTLLGNQLVVSGEKKESTERKEKGFAQSESRYGSFRRTVSLPEEVDAEKVEAHCANGVLTIKLKKIKPTPPKRIEVKAPPSGPAKRTSS
jgi:HSP20 family protein